MGVASLLLASAASAQTVETFESVPACNNVKPNMGIFSAFDFQSQWTCYNFAQNPFNPASGIARLYAVNGGSNASSASFLFLSPTQFQGAWFAGSASVQFQLSYLGAPVWSSASLATTATPTFLASGYAGNVDKVDVVGSSVAWVMDDVTYGTANVVPEPASVALVGAGLLAMAGLARRRRA